MSARSGLIFDLKKYAIHDGPGIRTTVFFKGCPLRCAWCHNPEGQGTRSEIMLKAGRCLPGCNACLKACAPKAIRRRRGTLEVNRLECDGCGRCVDACPSQAVELAGRRVEAAEVVDQVFRDRVFHEGSGGGVTFSGGEPLVQPDFLEVLLEECRRREAHTAVDTCGYVAPAVMERFAGRADLFLFDFKVMDDERHKRWTGVSNRVILENLRTLSRSRSKIVIRIPLVAGVNDDLDNIRRTAEFVRSLGTIGRFSLLPYHAMARDKYRRLDRGREHADLAAPTAEVQAQIKALLESYGFRVSLGD